MNARIMALFMERILAKCMASIFEKLMERIIAIIQIKALGKNYVARPQL